MAYSLDTDSWPVVRFTLQGKVAAPEEIAAMQRDLETDVLGREGKFVMIVDARAFSPGLRMARPWGEWLKGNMQRLRNQAVGTAFVNDSSLFRFRVSAMLLVQPLPNEYVITASVAEAEAWALRLLGRTGQLPKVAAVG